MHFEAWEHALKTTCGHFNAIPAERKDIVAGHFVEQRMNGLNAANFRCDIEMVERTKKDVRLDDEEHFYLILQIAGSSKVEMAGSRDVLSPGKLYLFDSTKPLKFCFEGESSHGLSLHLPRAAMLADTRSYPYIGRSLETSTNRVRALHRHLLDLLRRKQQASAPNPEYTLDLAKLAFAATAESSEQLIKHSSSRTRYELAKQDIEMYVSHPDISLPWLANRIGISVRQLERDFALFETSFIQTLRNQRLNMFLDMAKMARRAGRKTKITDLAFAVGFRDISNFNRAFRTRFEMSPRAFIRRQL